MDCTAENTKQAKPFVKWAGGKRQILKEIKKRLPGNFNSYFEPFAGGAAVFFSCSFKSAVIGDTNYELINAYSVIKYNVFELIESLNKHYYDKEYYYKIRSLNPEELNETERASRFIFLNRTCFNGLYRVNKKGKFNVPFGRYKSPLICDEKNLLLVSQKLKDTKIICGDYRNIVSISDKYDFIYFDPPYIPLNSTSKFVSYTQNGFSLDNQIELRDLFAELTEQGVYCMMSNSSAGEIINLYRNYNIDIVKAGRAVNSKAEKRGKIDEVIIMNY
jgi:DNA adenine methylase